MTYDQYQRLRQEWQKLIQKELQRFSPRAGNNVSVVGTDISVQLSPPPEEAKREPTWQYVIYGFIDVIQTGERFGPSLAARLPRPTGDAAQPVLNNSGFVDATQVVTQDGGFTRTKTITYLVTTATLAQIAAGQFDQGVFRGGLKLICEFYEETGGTQTFIRNYVLEVGRSGAFITLTAPEPNKFYYLRISAVERL